jgi:glycine/D-amino acid oxidase-like deaminating enzyme/nitrite reductase/ring-hydroxylating ferredoxin subunit
MKAIASKSIWKDSGAPRFPKLERSMRTDVVVVGAGITGITAAYLAKKAGFKVVLLERDRCLRGDTGCTSAHLTQVTDLRLPKLAHRFGRDHARAVWDAGQASVDQIETLTQDEDIDCHFQRVPGYLCAAADDKHPEELKKDAQLARDLGFDATYLNTVGFIQRPGVLFPNQARFDPLLYLSGLLWRIPGGACHVFEKSEAAEFHDDPLGVTVNGRTIRCQHLILATHVPLMGNTGLASATLFQTKLASFSSYVVAARCPKGAMPDALFWDTADPYHFIRLEPRRSFDLVVFGGEDHKTGQESRPGDAYRRLGKQLKALVPNAKLAARWSGQVVETADGLPYIGETAERQFVATGFAGNGMTFGTLGAMMAVDALTGRKNPWRELFDVNRKKLGALWNYVKENADYPYYFIKDKLLSGESKPVSSVKNGEGKILRLDGRRVAVYRDDDGSVTQLSPNCTHMGCIVHWNSAESTWDCPCHGSRFHATGKVLAGPAETPLEPIQSDE